MAHGDVLSAALAVVLLTGCPSDPPEGGGGSGGEGGYASGDGGAKDPTEGPFTAEEAAQRLGVAHTTVIQWLHDGMLAGEQLTPGAPWRIVLSEQTRRRRKTTLSSQAGPKRALRSLSELPRLEPRRCT